MLYKVVHTLPIYIYACNTITHEHTRQRQRHEHTHTRTHNTTHTTQPARQRHHLGTATHGTTSASRSANITQRDTLPKGGGNLKIFRSARGQSTSHIFWVFQKGVANFIFSEFPKGGHTTFHTRLHTAVLIMLLMILSA